MATLASARLLVVTVMLFAVTIHVAAAAAPFTVGLASEPPSEPPRPLTNDTILCTSGSLQSTCYVNLTAALEVCVLGAALSPGVHSCHVVLTRPVRMHTPAYTVQ